MYPRGCFGGYRQNNKWDIGYFIENSKFFRDMVIQSFLDFGDICFLFTDMGYFSKYLKGYGILPGLHQLRVLC